MGGLSKDAKNVCAVIRMRADRSTKEQILIGEIICAAVMDACGQGFAHETKFRQQEILDAQRFFFDGRMDHWGGFIDIHPDFVIGLMRKINAGWLKGKNGSNSTKRGYATQTAVERAERGVNGLGTRLSRGPFDTRGQRPHEGRAVSKSSPPV